MQNSKLLSQLPEIGRHMTEIHALEPLLEYSIDISCQLLNAQFGYLVLVDDDNSLDFRIAHDKHGNNIVDPKSQISHTILYHVIETKKFVRTAKAITDSNFENAESVTALDLKSVLCVPLISLGMSIGVIYLENRDIDNLFQDSDVEPLQFLAGHAAACIQNVIFREEIERLSHRRVEDLSDLIAEGELLPGVFQNALEKERSRILDYFIQDVSHQFRTPLAVIKTSVDVLSRKISSDISGNYFPRIHEQVDTIVKLVDSLKLLATLDVEDDYTFQEDDLGLIVRDMWDVLVHRAYQKGIDAASYAGSQTIKVFLIQDLARQAIGKVLENAIMYTEAGGTVTVDVIETENAGHIIIADSGIGIELDDLPHVMERFFRSDKAGTTRGLGLGLTITHKIMMAHDGEIRIDSQPGEGTRVELIFPKDRGE